MSRSRSPSSTQESVRKVDEVAAFAWQGVVPACMLLCKELAPNRPSIPRGAVGFPAHTGSEGFLCLANLL